MTQEQKERVRIVQGHFADIDKRISQIDEIIGRLTPPSTKEPFPSYVQFPESIVVLQLQSFRKSVPICLSLVLPDAFAAGLVWFPETTNLPARRSR